MSDLTIAVGILAVLAWAGFGVLVWANGWPPGADAKRDGPAADADTRH